MEAIDMLLNDLESELLKAKKAPFSNTDIIVNRKTVLELVSRIRASLPQVIRDAMQITRDEQEIIARANAYAQSAIDDAQARMKSAVDESEVVRQAQAQAAAIIEDAKTQYNHIIMDAREHGLALLAAAEQQIGHLLDVCHESMNNLQNV